MWKTVANQNGDGEDGIDGYGGTQTLIRPEDELKELKGELKDGWTDVHSMMIKKHPTKKKKGKK